MSWTGQIRADFGDKYTFSTVSDDGVRLWIGNELVIDDYGTHTATEDSGAKWLEPGKWYDFRLEYFDATGLGPDCPQLVKSASDWRPSLPSGAAGQSPRGVARGLRKSVGPGPGSVGYLLGRQLLLSLYSSGNSVWISRSASASRTSTTARHSANRPRLECPGRHRATRSKSGPRSCTTSGATGTSTSRRRTATMRRIGCRCSSASATTHSAHLRASDKSAAATDRWAIDGTVFEWDNTWYFVWSGWPGSTDGQQNLYIAEMRNPWTLADRIAC